VIWPWSRFEDLSDVAEALRALLHDAETKMAVEAVERRVLERDLERSLAELHLVQQDFKQLIHVTARPVTKTTPIDFTRDPFTEDPKLPDSWLTDDSILPDIEVIEDQLSAESQRGEREGSGTRQGAEG
jgi:hypothetical protein